MKVLVTGGAGQVGSAVAREFLACGYEVRILDLSVPAPDLREKCEVVYCDLRDRLGISQAMEGIEAVAHLAAIPNPMHGYDKQLFGPNVEGTQILLDVATEFGVGRFVLASSCSIYGFPFQHRAWDNDRPVQIEPKYLPMDEDHPLDYEDIYALSKHLNELTAAMYSRRTGMATTCLRLTAVVDLEHRRPWFRRNRGRAQEWKSRDLWAYVEQRDVARAFRLAIENVNNGHHVLQICAQDSFLSPEDQREAIEKHYPHLLPFLDNGFDYKKNGFWNCRRAEEVLGWRSENHWRDTIQPEED